MKIGLAFKKTVATAAAVIVLSVGAMSGQTVADASGPRARDFETPRYETVAFRLKHSQIIGTWMVTLKTGWFIVSFDRNGAFAIMHSKYPKSIGAGTWSKRGSSVRLAVTKACNRKMECKALPVSKQTVLVFTVRSANAKRLHTSYGTMKRVAT